VFAGFISQGVFFGGVECWKEPWNAGKERGAAVLPSGPWGATRGVRGDAADSRAYRPPRARLFFAGPCKNRSGLRSNPRLGLGPSRSKALTARLRRVRWTPLRRRLGKNQSPALHCGRSNCPATASSPAGSSRTAGLEGAVGAGGRTTRRPFRIRYISYTADLGPQQIVGWVLRPTSGTEPRAGLGRRCFPCPAVTAANVPFAKPSSWRLFPPPIEVGPPRKCISW